MPALEGLLITAQLLIEMDMRTRPPSEHTTPVLSLHAHHKPQDHLAQVATAAK